MSDEAISSSSADVIEAAPPRLLSARKIALQATAWLIGLALLAWVIHSAIGRSVGGEEGNQGVNGWELIRHASPWLVAGLVCCTLVSLFSNGVIFWLVIRPVMPLRLLHLQLINLVTAVLNYAPIRLGLIARVAYHLRVDRMPPLLLGGWFAAVLFTMLLTMAAVLGATMLRPGLSWQWGGLLAVLLVAGVVLTLAMLGLPVVKRLGRGMDRLLSEPRTLAGATALRLFDVAAFTGRMACAAAILKLDLSTRDIVFLGVATLAMSLNPLGRFGFREWAVAVIAAQLVSVQMTGSDLKARLAQLALVESAGEAIVSIPLGAVSLLWYRSRWARARGNAETPKR